MVQKPESDTEPKERRIDLSVPQVAGSAVAAVAAAVAASQLGVYGTVLGAGVMSVVATCGGSVFQHFFRRTGEQIREVTVQVKHPDREVSVHAAESVAGRAPKGARRSPDGTPPGTLDATAVMRAVDAAAGPREADETMLLRGADGAPVPRDPDGTMLLRHVAGDRNVAGDAERTRMLPAYDGSGAPATGRPAVDEEFSEATTHGTRVRGWKRSALGAAVVFALTMAGITTYELISGSDLSGGKGTTVGSVVRGGERNSGTDDPAPQTDTGPGRERTPEQGDGTATPGTTPQDGRSGAPETGRGGGPSTAPTTGPTPSGDTGDRTSQAPETTPSPAASGDGGAPTDPAPAGTDDAPAQGDRGVTGAETGQ
ncbi:hypothetical protein [Streptomyces sp. ML-6]|uniref:hypothetical protein n=1 Tax=Streptomyces sp. ML-6 TaxID=2982693 RepID=UPI0024BF72C0|nr:hypothetical protein [Streptomyces sp. ML-6]MDK0522747.1 hypothetical protein [Streptomyces sp. ML-6]